MRRTKSLYLPQDPEITLLKNKITSLREDVRFLRGQVDNSKIKIKGLEHQLDVCIFSFGRRLAKVVGAVGVEPVLIRRMFYFFLKHMFYF